MHILAPSQPHVERQQETVAALDGVLSCQLRGAARPAAAREAWAPLPHQDRCQSKEMPRQPTSPAVPRSGTPGFSAVDILATPRGQRYAERLRQHGFHENNLRKEAEVRSLQMKLALGSLEEKRKQNTCKVASTTDKINEHKQILKELAKNPQPALSEGHSFHCSWKESLAAEGLPLRRESVRDLRRRILMEASVAKANLQRATRLASAGRTRPHTGARHNALLWTAAQGAADGKASPKSTECGTPLLDLHRQ